MAKSTEFNQIEEVLAPARSLNELAFANVERLVNLQIDSTRKYADICLQNMREAFEIKDLSAAQAYMVKQREVAQNVTENLVNDAKAVAEIGRQYTDKVQKVFAKGVADTSKKAA